MSGRHSNGSISSARYGSYNHYPVGWALAGNTPFKLCKQYTHFGGTRNPLIVHWPKGIRAKGEIRTQFHHAIDIAPTILSAIGVESPRIINGVQQQPIEGVPRHSTTHSLRTPRNPQAGILLTRDTHRNPTWHVVVSIGSGMRAAGRYRMQ